MKSHLEIVSASRANFIFEVSSLYTASGITISLKRSFSSPNLLSYIREIIGVVSETTSIKSNPAVLLLF